MPRKKAAAALAPGDPAPAATSLFHGVCPGCKSKITFDRNGPTTLNEKSAYLEELLETDAGVDEVEKSIGALEKKLAEANATIANRDARVHELVGQLEAAKSKPAAQPATVKTEKEKENVGKKTGSSWWD